MFESISGAPEVSETNVAELTLGVTRAFIEGFSKMMMIMKLFKQRLGRAQALTYAQRVENL